MHTKTQTERIPLQRRLANIEKKT